MSVRAALRVIAPRTAAAPRAPAPGRPAPAATSPALSPAAGASRGAARGDGPGDVIVADTGAVLALIDADDRHHAAMRALFERDPRAWVLPWAVLSKVDYMLLAHVGARAELAFVRDVAEGLYAVELGGPCGPGSGARAVRAVRRASDRARGWRGDRNGGAAARLRDRDARSAAFRRGRDAGNAEALPARSLIGEEQRIRVIAPPRTLRRVHGAHENTGRRKGVFKPCACGWHPIADTCDRSGDRTSSPGRAEGDPPRLCEEGP